jgi:hypothetical protein
MFIVDGTLKRSLTYWSEADVDPRNVAMRGSEANRTSLIKVGMSLGHSLIQLCGPAQTQHGVQKVVSEAQKELRLFGNSEVNIITNFKNFLKNWNVYQKITKEGLSVLPIIRVNGRIITEREYPKLEMLINEVEKNRE